MRRRFDEVYQFKVTLNGVRPPVWRRIQVPGTYTFWDLHVAIQDAMGWTDAHLHEFEMNDPSTGCESRIGVPDSGSWEANVLPAWRQPIAHWFSFRNRNASYTYDFGDNWEHRVQLEKILPRGKSTPYPRCVAGRRACPPEDCGGAHGYAELLFILSKPRHKQHREIVDWIGDEFDPDYFEVHDVVFDDPDVRRALMFD